LTLNVAVNTGQRDCAACDHLTKLSSLPLAQFCGLIIYTIVDTC